MQWNKSRARTRIFFSARTPSAVSSPLRYDINLSQSICNALHSTARIAEEYGSSNRPVCHFLSGFFVGVLEEIFGEKLMGKQIKCISKGDPYCEFQFEKY